MKVTLISPYPDITAFGLRNISSFLRHHHVQTRMVFLPDPLGYDLIADSQRYSDNVLDYLVRLSSDSDLIGIGLMTNYFDNARQITSYLKKNGDVPILWGGVHATIRPDECIRLADMVCVGDGEEAVLELVRRIEHNQPIDNIPNIWIRTNGNIVQNMPRPLTQNIDSFPAPDYSCQDHHVLYNGRIHPLDVELTKTILSHGTVSQHLGRIGYQTMTGRGCPHKCSYCINDAVKNLYGPKGYLRWRSVGHVIAELKWAKHNLPFINFIWISDDAFFSRSLKDIQSFCNAYREEIGLPFSCLASPLTMTEEKMECLVNAGLIYLQMGVQSGSARIQALFNRKAMNNAVMLSAMKIIHQYRDRIYPPSYDFILDVPYETIMDKIESLRLIARIPKPFRLQPFSLVLYPGTHLYKMAKADGLIQNENADIYTKSYTRRAPTYTNFLILLSKNGKFPSWLLCFLSAYPIVALMERQCLQPIFKAVFAGIKQFKMMLRPSVTNG
jgi:radical SAM superfamily enzyme YgiQ (UPF0313 family)